MLMLGVYVWYFGTTNCGEVTINTSLGTIKGIQRQVLNKTLLEFRKIPYAKPPLNELRFERPLPYGSWDGVLDASAFGPSCYQHLFDEMKFMLENKDASEDCLHLNIYVPETVSPNVPRSVMIWIHGGGYNIGQATVYDAAKFSVVGDVVIVTINYRLNMFGFLSFDEMDGNFGLWDQILAIKWVKNNIGNFGGNGNSITIFGESAGGSSVGLLSIIPDNRGLFQRAIMQSGVALNPWAIVRKSDRSQIEKSIPCNTTLIQCLKEMPADTLFTKLVPYFLMESSLFETLPAPVVDGVLFKKDPYDLLRDKNSEASKFFRSLDVIVGTTSGESSLLFSYITPPQQSMNFNISVGIPKVVLNDYLAPEISKYMYKDNPIVTKAVVEHYGKSNDNITLSLDILDAYSDVDFHKTAVSSLRLHSDGNTGRQYQYLFHGVSPIPIFGPLPPWFNRSEHAADTWYQFDNLFLPMKTLSTELSRMMMLYWTNFAKTG